MGTDGLSLGDGVSWEVKNETSECVECLPCAKYFAKISSSNLCEREKSKQRDQRERVEPRETEVGWRVNYGAWWIFECVYILMAHTNTEPYLYYLLICPLWSCPGYLKSDLAQ